MKTHLFKRLSAIVCAAVMGFGILMSASAMTASAAVVDSTSTDIIDYISGGGNPGSVGLTKGSSTKDDATYGNSYKCVLVDGTYYYWQSADTASVQGKIASAKNNSADKVADDVNDITGGLNIEADTGTASRTLTGFTGVFNTLLGIIVVLITIGMALFSAFDLCYIAFPVFRNKCEEAKQSGQGIMASNKKGANGETKIRFVSDDAQYAVTAADTVQSGKNPFVIYFGKRLISYIALAVLVFILLTGNIDIFTRLALKLVSGVLDVIQGI